ncbi:uncharacterized isoform X5 [Zea mays]|uniref:uncharacterized isoform X5 n=1 Tax=Zea mays TaxID=4577 RepID=UPI001652A9E4|nr:uncharacterized protein LOC100383647 isoform X5 [Zea mays]
MSRKYQRKSGIVWHVKERNLRDNVESLQIPKLNHPRAFKDPAEVLVLFEICYWILNHMKVGFGLVLSFKQKFQNGLVLFLEQFEDKKTSIGNWIQCREVLDTGVVCGKWRRAPLFVVQSSDWDCSCSVVWDPIHADCAVPQELETVKVHEQLKYINKLKNRLGDSNQKR